MKIGGYSLGEHIRLLIPLFAFIAVVWLLRMLVDGFHLPNLLVRILSVTGAQSVAILFAVVLIHMRRFGGYPNVIVVSFLLATWAQMIIILAIVFAELTGIDNIFTAPEFSIPHDDPFHLRHIVGHLTFGIGGGTLIGTALGCLLLWVLRKVVPVPQPTNIKPQQPTGI
jgi:hypothetical protein